MTEQEKLDFERRFGTESQRKIGLNRERTRRSGVNRTENIFVSTKDYEGFVTNRRRRFIEKRFAL